MTTAKLYVPTGVRRALEAYVRHEIAERFGGYTAYEGAQGGWINDRGELVEEEVNVVEVVTDMKAPQVHTHMNHLATYVWEQSDETAVMFTVGGDKYMIE